MVKNKKSTSKHSSKKSLIYKSASTSGSSSPSTPASLSSNETASKSRHNQKGPLEGFNFKTTKIGLISATKHESRTMRIYAIRFLQSLKDPDDPRIVFNTVCFLLLSLLGDKINGQFCSLMDSLMPITNVRSYMERFDEQHSMAMLFHKNLAHVLNYWHLGALQWHQKVKTKMIQIQCAEFFLRFLIQQSIGFKNYLERMIDQAAKDFQSTGVHAESKIVSLPDISVDITLHERRISLKLDDAMEAVAKQKNSITKAAECSALYVRCIKELMEINASNTAKIHSYHFRWNPIKAFNKFYRNKLALQLPYSDLHKAYAAIHSEAEQESAPTSVTSPGVSPVSSVSSTSTGHNFRQKSKKLRK